MRFFVGVLLIVSIKSSHSINLPCEFNFDHENGYSCKVVNFTNKQKIASVINKVVGTHLYQNDNNYRNRSNESVNRVVMWNITVHFLPGNLTVQFPYLRTLQVKKCGLKQLTRNTELNVLRHIYLGFNDIEQIPVNYFLHFCKLETLSLHENKISSIPEMAFRDLQSLKRLSLNGNRLTELSPKLFNNCLSLEYIDLDNNFLKRIDGHLFSNLTKMKRIYLRHNRLSSIGNDFLSNLPNLEFAFFLNNECINLSFPEFIWNQLSPLESIQSMFQEFCPMPIEVPTTTRRTSTLPPHKKPKFKSKPIIYFENCKWITPKGQKYF